MHGCVAHVTSFPPCTARPNFCWLCCSSVLSDSSDWGSWGSDSAADDNGSINEPEKLAAPKQPNQQPNPYHMSLRTLADTMDLAMDHATPAPRPTAWQLPQQAVMRPHVRRLATAASPTPGEHHRSASKRAHRGLQVDLNVQAQPLQLSKLQEALAHISPSAELFSPGSSALASAASPSSPRRKLLDARGLDRLLSPPESPEPPPE